MSCTGDSAQSWAQVYPAWRHQQVIFDDVDVVTPIEPHAGDVAVPHIIRAANRKSFREIHHEIRAVQARPTESAQTGGLVNLAPLVPILVRNIFYGALRHNLHWSKAIQGTVIVTAVGMFRQGSSWGNGFLPNHTLGSRSQASAASPA
jgi:hypothetical protein